MGRLDPAPPLSPSPSASFCESINVHPKPRPARDNPRPVAREPPNLDSVYERDSMIFTRGMNIAMTIEPTINARKMIMIGSNSEVIPSTALSTSSS